MPLRRVCGSCAGFHGDGRHHETTIPGGRYATLNFKGAIEQAGEAWAALLRDWLPPYGFQLDARPCFEYYPQGAASDPQTVEICIPVMPL
jgi:AraC family transcriptional regulator